MAFHTEKPRLFPKGSIYFGKDAEIVRSWLDGDMEIKAINEGLGDKKGGMAYVYIARWLRHSYEKGELKIKP